MMRGRPNATRTVPVLELARSLGVDETKDALDAALAHRGLDAEGFAGEGLLDLGEVMKSTKPRATGGRPKPARVHAELDRAVGRVARAFNIKDSERRDAVRATALLLMYYGWQTREGFVPFDNWPGFELADLRGRSRLNKLTDYIRRRVSRIA